MADSTFADISEFQSNFDADAYLAGGHRVIIARAHNGSRPDHMWPARRDYIRKYPFAAVGYYQYFKASVDAAQQARDFVACLGPLRANEFPICDCEEGSGNQTGRVKTWMGVVDPWCGFDSSLYAGESFFQTNLGGSGSWGAHPIWMAAYRSSEPTAKHDWWQNTDHASFPGLAGGVDGNIFHGSPEQFLARVRPGGAAAPGPAPSAGQGTRLSAVVGADGRLEVFDLKSSGEVVHAYQVAPNAGWAGSAPGQAASFYSLGNPGR
jgi:lysozyme